MTVEFSLPPDAQARMEMLRDMHERVDAKEVGDRVRGGIRVSRDAVPPVPSDGLAIRPTATRLPSEQALQAG